MQKDCISRRLGFLFLGACAAAWPGAALAEPPGTALGTEFEITSGIYTGDVHHAAAQYPDGHFLVAWSGSGLVSGIAARRFTASGSALSDEYLLNDTPPTGRVYQVEASIGKGGHGAVAWALSAQTNLQIYLRRLSPEGAPIGADILVDEPPFGFVGGEVAVAVTDEGATAVVWTASSATFEPSQVFLKTYDLNGEPEGPAQNVSALGPIDLEELYAFRPRIVLDRLGGYLVAWSSFDDNDEESRVFARRVTRDGVPGVRSTVSALPDENGPVCVAAQKDGHFVVAWQRFPMQNSPRILMQRYDVLGAKTGSRWVSTVNPHCVELLSDAAGNLILLGGDLHGSGAPTLRMYRESAKRLTSGAIDLTPGREIDIAGGAAAEVVYTRVSDVAFQQSRIFAQRYAGP